MHRERKTISNITVRNPVGKDLLKRLNFDNDGIILKMTSKEYYGPTVLVSLDSRQGAMACCFGYGDEHFGS
jgi:hypothetical protein